MEYGYICHCGARFYSPNDPVDVRVRLALHECPNDEGRAAVEAVRNQLERQGIHIESF
jgi:hypothetical protein